MKRFALITTAAALSLSIAAPGFAAETIGVSPGQTQLARELGVKPGEFSASELARLLDAERNDETVTVNLITTYGGQNGKALPENDRTAAGHVQLARKLGVDPQAFSGVELAQLDVAVREGDEDRIHFIKTYGGDNAHKLQKPTRTSAGHIQLARELGVDPAAFSTSELSRLHDAVRENDDETRRYILSKGS